MHITLTVVSGPHQGEVFTFRGQESFVVGRAKRALFRLPKKDRYISRHHFVVEVNPPHFRLLDLQSRNGTFVNGKRVQCADLRHEDVIRLGHTKLQVRLEGVEEDAFAEPRELMDTVRQSPSHVGRLPVDDPHSWEPLPEEPPLEQAPPVPVAEQPTFRVADLAPPPRVPVDAPTDQEMDLPPYEEMLAEAQEPPIDLGDAAFEASSSSTGKTEAEVSLSALLDEADISLDERCPLCGQVWEPGTATGSRPQVWCGLCAKAMKLLPQICPGYRLVRELGRGATGVVYQAVREDDQAVVAVRHLTPEEGMSPKRRQRFHRELAQLQSLRHPGLVPLLAHVEADGQLFLVLEHSPGETAAQALEQSGPFAPSRAVELLCHCLEALECAHALGVLHREIRPSSIQLETRGGTEQARLMDFGLEWLCQIAHVSRYSLLKGQGETVSWTPPELVYNVKNVTPASDVYSLGAAFYTLMSGQPLFTGAQTMEHLLRQVLEEEPPLLSTLRTDLPPSLAEVLHLALAKEPESRYGSAQAFRIALEPFRHVMR